MKTLIIAPEDVSSAPMGATSSTSDVEVAVQYLTHDGSDITLTDGTFIPSGVPTVATSIPKGGLKVDVLPNDDPTIVSGSGFVIRVDFTYTAKTGFHRRSIQHSRHITVTTDDMDEVPFGPRPAVVPPAQIIASLETKAAGLAAQVQALTAQNTALSLQNTALSAANDYLREQNTRIVAEYGTEGSILTGTGAPTATDKTRIGDLYYDSATDDLWRYEA